MSRQQPRARRARVLDLTFAFAIAFAPVPLAAAESEASPCVEPADAFGLQPPEVLYSGGGASPVGKTCHEKRQICDRSYSK